MNLTYTWSKFALKQRTQRPHFFARALGIGTLAALHMTAAVHGEGLPEGVQLDPATLPSELAPAPIAPILEKIDWPVFEDKLAAALDASWLEITLRAGLPAIYAAVIMANEERLSEWLYRGAWADEPTAGGDRALAAALRWREHGSLRQLLSAGPELDFCEAEGQPLLVLAALRRQTEGMRLLLQHGFDPDPRSRHPMSPRLIEEQGLKDLRYSLERDRELTPLMICAAHGDAAGVELLMASGAKLNTYTRVNKRYPINFASMQGYNYIMQLLLGRQPEKEADQRVVINLSRQRAELLRNGELVDSTSVSTGRKGYTTPSGTFVITNKHTSWTSTIYKVPMPWFMRLSCGSIGLHAGNVPGYPASHGCIRLPHSKAKAFFAEMRVGDLVEIVR